MFGAYYVAMALVGLAWLWLLRVVRRSRTPTTVVLLVAALWAVPFFVGPPVGSDDAITYAASGKLVNEGFDPYEVGIIALTTKDPFVRAASATWWTSPQPYGPLHLRLSAAAQSLGGSSFRATVLVLRGACVLSLALLAVPLAALARRFERPPAEVLAAVLCSPLVVVHLVGGVHNEAAMLLPLVAGVAVAVRGFGSPDRRRGMALLVAGVALCGVAATVKVTALFAAPVLGWLWQARASAGRRVVAAAVASTVAGLVVVVVSVASGLGLGWIENLDVPEKVETLLSPFTAVGTLVRDVSGSEVVDAFRRVGSVIGLAVALFFVVKADRLGLPLAVGGGLSVLALTAPVVWAWYFAWGLPFLVLRSVPAWLQVSVVALNFTVTPLGPGTLDVNGFHEASAVFATVAWTVAAALAVRWWRSRKPRPAREADPQATLVKR